ncbi:hypothetical protein [Bythopirellula polymerisocia]|uniref:Immunoglobulin G-binding protein A n=1 Tax=Bythopirellula polymerisocia TaxID=2528003 RepID=A0A5C6CHK9_9BACT|nr:hypothetical protein [Bythopirellula polymerisocia]TWU22761.1 hypothetical protein Pla144_42220 [Bythopirellula polymerisocia]
MASVIESSPPPVSRAEERLVDEQIRRTLRSLKLLDLMAGIITLVIGVLAFLLTAAVLDQWVIPGGWNGTMRLVLLVLLLGGVGWYCWRAFWPLMSRSINPAYAAQLIERNTPSLKNSLLNFLLLRTERRQLSQKVYQAIEQQAAQRLSEVSMDTVVDRSALLRLGYVLVAVVALCAMYRVLSPKNLTTSISRVLMPWSEIAVPSRVEILDVTPGDTSLARGEPLPISAEVHGLNEDEPVEVHYSTLDGQAEDRVVPLTGTVGGLRFEGKIPDKFSSEGGVQQDLEYWITAGDARSPKYRATVYARPTLVVDRIRYEFPAYTGLASREVEGTGDIHALEGTKVILYAQANQQIASAHVDFAADGRHDLTMKSNGEKANAEFTLALKEDRRTPQHGSYVLRYKTESGRTNNKPPKYEIDVTPDYAPEIEIIAPRDEEDQPVEQLDVPVNQEFTIEVEARDPDFLLSQVSLLGQLGGKQVLDHALLSEEHEGRFVGRFSATPEELDLKPGDILEYWGTASDNRRPQANVAETSKQRIRVIGPPQFDQQNPTGEGQQDQNGGGDGSEDGEGGESGDQQGEASGAGGEGEQGESQEGGGEGEQGEGGEGEQQLGGDGAGGESSESDGDSGEQQENQQGSGGEQSESGDQQQPGKVSAEGDDDGEAFERISDHMAEKDTNSQNQEGQANQGQNGETESQPGESGGEGQPDSDQSGESSDAENAQEGEADTDGTEQERESQGAGAEGDPAGEEQGAQSDKTQQSGDGEEPESPEGEMSGEQGEAGAGENPGEEQGSPDALDKQSGDKSDEESKDPQENDQEAPGQGRGDKESDSQGGQGGDRSGGGQEGGGQQADAEGTGAAGENTAADDGAGQAAEPGAGEDSAKPGDDGTAEQPTGQPGEEEPGQGSGESAEGSGNKPSGEEGQTAAGEEAQQPGSEGGESSGQPEASDSADPANMAGQQPPGGGTGGSSSPPPPGELEPGDEANLDYARKQSDLVLDRLEDQLDKDSVDQEMLEKLGWSKEDLRKFVDRWKGLMNAAEQEGPAGDEAQQELDNALRSLGLRPGRRGYQSQAIQEKLRELKDSYRGQTPLEYADQVRAYIKGTATAGDEKD